MFNLAESRTIYERKKETNKQTIRKKAMIMNYLK